jgi:hypothetical protein
LNHENIKKQNSIINNSIHLKVNDNINDEFEQFEKYDNFDLNFKNSLNGNKDFYN